jgi:hypothetical protein
MNPGENFLVMSGALSAPGVVSNTGSISLTNLKMATIVKLKKHLFSALLVVYISLFNAQFSFSTTLFDEFHSECLQNKAAVKYKYEGKYYTFYDRVEGIEDSNYKNEYEIQFVQHDEIKMPTDPNKMTTIPIYYGYCYFANDRFTASLTKGKWYKIEGRLRGCSYNQYAVFDQCSLAR